MTANDQQTFPIAGKTYKWKDGYEFLIDSMSGTTFKATYTGTINGVAATFAMDGIFQLLSKGGPRLFDVILYSMQGFGSTGDGVTDKRSAVEALTGYAELGDPDSVTATTTVAWAKESATSGRETASWEAKPFVQQND